MMPLPSIRCAASTVIALLCAVASAGCGAPPTSAAPWSDVPSREPRYAIPIGAVDGRERCTAWHAGGGWMVTARHCLSNPNDAASASVSFDLLASVESPTWQPLQWPQEDVQPHQAPVTLVHVDNPPAGCLKSAKRLPQQGEPILIVHQTCDPWREGAACLSKKRQSRGTITYAGDIYVHDALALPGSSGAPVMTDDGQFRVLGIHTWGGSNRHGILVSIMTFQDRIFPSWCP